LTKPSNILMNKLTQRIKSILEELKQEKGIETKKKDYCIIQLTFDIQDFYLKCNTIGEFLKKLRNNKNSLSPNLPNNRVFFNIIGGNGIHHSTFYTDKVEINIYLELKKKFNVLEMKSRISKIIKPTNIEITFNDDKVLSQTFKSNFVVSSWGIFGEEYRKQPVV
jgi:hypothetical protein